MLTIYKSLRTFFTVLGLSLLFMVVGSELAQAQSVTINCTPSGSSPNQVLNCSYSNAQAPNFTCNQRIGGEVCNSGGFFTPYPACNTETWVENSSVAKTCRDSENEFFSCKSNTCVCKPGYVKDSSGNRCVLPPSYIELSPSQKQQGLSSTVFNLETQNGLDLLFNNTGLVLDNTGGSVNAKIAQFKNGKVDVDGTIEANIICFAGSNDCRDNWPTSSSSSPGVGQWEKNGADIYYTDGNVGIGITDPEQALVVDGTDKVGFGFNSAGQNSLLAIDGTVSLGVEDPVQVGGIDSQLSISQIANNIVGFAVNLPGVNSIGSYIDAPNGIGLEVSSDSGTGISVETITGTGLSIVTDSGTAIDVTTTSGEAANFTGGYVYANDGLVLGSNATGVAGAIRWTGTDFEGYDGGSWNSLTSGGGGGLWENGVNGVYEDDSSVIVGIDQAETLSDPGFALGVGTLFIANSLGVENGISLDGNITFGAASMTVGDGSISKLTAGPIVVSLGENPGDDFVIDTSTLVVQSDTNQVGIGTGSPATSALLDLTSTTGALLVPRMSDIERNALTAANGMIIYNTAEGELQGRANGAWVNLGNTGGASLWETGANGTYEDDAAVIVGADAAFTYLGGVVGDLRTAGALEVMSGGYINNDLIVGAGTSSTETLANAGFVVDGDDLFVAGLAGIEGGVYTDGEFVAGASLTLGDTGITDSNSDINFTSTTDGFNFAFTDGGVGDDFSIDGSTFVVESDNNRVGIGTNTPATDLHIERVADGGATGISIVNPSTSAGIDTQASINAYNNAGSYAGFTQYGENAGSILFGIPRANLSAMGSIGAANTMLFTNTGPFYTVVNGSTALYIDTAQQIGIGNTSPNNILDVTGTAEFDAVKITTGATNGFILQSNASGDATWVDPGVLSGGLWEDGVNGVYEDDKAVIVGADIAETISNTNFAIEGQIGIGDLFVTDELGVEDDIYTDGTLNIGTTFSISEDTITKTSTGGPLIVNIGNGAGDELIIDGGTLAVEGDTNRVGIGTVNPIDSAALDITSTTGALVVPRMTDLQRNALTAADGMIIYNTVDGELQGRANGAWVNLGDTGGTSLWETGANGSYEDDAAVIVGPDAAFTYLGGGIGDLRTAGALEVMSGGYINNDLVVGASTSSTETLSNAGFIVDGDDLFVAGLAGAEGGFYTDGSFVAGASLTLNDTGITDSNSDINFTSTTDGFNFIFTDGLDGDDFTVNTNNFVVESDTGEVGIGISDPTAALHVYQENGDLNFISDLAILDHATNDVSAGGVGTGLLFRAENTAGTLINAGRVAGELMQATVGDEVGELVFFTGTQNNLVEQVRIDGAGNVGIGTINPGEALDVVGSGAFTDNIYVGDTLETLDNPGFILDGDDQFIAGMLGVEGNVYTDGAFVAGSGTTSYANGLITQSTGGILEISLGGAGGDNFQVDTDTFVVASDTNNVGIGTAVPDPNAALDISSTTGALLIPRMTNINRAALTPTDGMIIYNLDNVTYEGYSNGTWENLLGGGGGGLWVAGTNGTYEEDAAVIVGPDVAFTYIGGGAGDLGVGGNSEVLGNSFIAGNAVIGAVTSSSETLDNPSYSQDFDDLFVAGSIGAEDSIYTDNSFVAGNNGLTLTNGLISQGTAPLSVTLGGAPGDNFSIDSSTFFLESDQDEVGIGTLNPGAKLAVETEDGTVSDVTDILSIAHTTGATAQPNMSAGLLFNVEDDAGQTTSIARLSGTITNVTDGFEGGGLDFYVSADGVVYHAMRLDTNGYLGLGLGTNDATHPIEVGTANGAHVTSGGTWTNGSSRTFKDRKQALDAKEMFDKMMQLDVEGWYYKDTDEYHIGPYAEDFYDLFGTGTDNRYLSSLDTSGLALISLQYLGDEVEDLRATVEDQQDMIDELQIQLEQLQQQVDNLK